MQSGGSDSHQPGGSQSRVTSQGGNRWSLPWRKVPNPCKILVGTTSTSSLKSSAAEKGDDVEVVPTSVEAPACPVLSVFIGALAPFRVLSVFRGLLPLGF